MIYRILINIILLFTLTNLFFKCYAQNSKVIINHEYIKKNQIKNIRFFVPINIEWIKLHPAFSPQINIKEYIADYDNDGYCYKLMWRLCSWDSTLQNIDTTLSSLEHYLYFKYQNHKLQRLDAITFSKINYVDFNYFENKVIRHIAYTENNQVKTQIDTILDTIIQQNILNPYEWSIYPYYQMLIINDEWGPYFYLNNIPLPYFDNELNANDIIIEIYPGLLVRTQ
ncbi:MAG: hypothetical protein HPY79_05155 [Bacteroidales bacterium]|nr:hypothetical protein [Bacteroidales bacterium]